VKEKKNAGAEIGKIFRSRHRREKWGSHADLLHLSQGGLREQKEKGCVARRLKEGIKQRR